MKEFTYHAEDGIEITAIAWEIEQPKLVLQLAHGMAEHIRRYDEFAQYLNERGIVVVGNDHRGHGKTANVTGHGFFAEENGFERVVNDMKLLTDVAMERWPGIPLVLMGHSMGSFLTRRYIQLYGERLAGCILSGTGGNPGILATLGQFVAKWQMKRNGKQAPSPIMNQLSFGSFNKRFKPNRTEFDWLSRDAAQVDAYINDPWCGKVFSASFFYDLLGGLKTIHRMENIALTPKHLPIYLFSGDVDPVGNEGKGVRSVYEQLRASGIQNVTLKLYEKGRHEMLNEMNRGDVYRDVYQWLLPLITK